MEERCQCIIYQAIFSDHENGELRLEGSLPKAGLLLGYSEEEKTWKTFCLSTFVNSEANIAVACAELDLKFVRNLITFLLFWLLIAHP